MTEPILSVRDLTIDLPPGSDRPHAVERVSFDLFENEILCLVGESGSGKSLTAAVLQANQGAIIGEGVVDQAAEAVRGMFPGVSQVPAGYQQR